MIILTETYKDLEESIATICNCSVDFLYKVLSDFYYQCIDDSNKYDKMIDCFINENANLYLIDEVCIYHLARHFSEPIELLPLKDLLLTENAFSAFLAENNIVFKENNGQLELYYKQQLIKPQDLLSDRHHLLLAKRLGYFSEADYCINGFAFWPDIEETSDGYYEELRISPEFIRKIGDFLGKR